MSVKHYTSSMKSIPAIVTVPVVLLLQLLMISVCHNCGSDRVDVDQLDERTCIRVNAPLIQHGLLENLYYIRYQNTLESIIDLMRYWRRTQGTFIIDHFSEIQLESARRYLKVQLTNVDVHYVQSLSDIDLVVKKIQFLCVHVVIVCGAEATNAIVEQANQIELFSMNHTWIIASPTTPYSMLGVDITPESQVTLMVPRPPTSLANEDDEMEQWNSLQHVSVQGQRHAMNETRLGQLLETARDIDIYDVFFVPQSQRTEIVKFAEWNEISRLVMLTRPDGHQGLRGRRIRITVFEHEPYTNFARHNGQLIITGYLKEMFDMILDRLNIQYSIKEVEEVFGIGINGTYTGFVGRLFRREADMAMNVLAVTNSRYPALRYAGPVTKAHLAIIYNRPPMSIPPTMYLLPFSHFVWFCVLITLVIVVFFLALVNSVSPCQPAIRSHSVAFRIFTFTFLEEVFDYPVGCAAKIFYGTLLVGMVTVFAHYTSVFTSFLTYQEENIPFRNLEDVATVSNDYTVLIVLNGRHQDQFQYARGGIFADIWQRVVKQGNRSFEKSFKSGLLKSYTGRYVYLSDGPTCMFLAATNCSVAFSPSKYTQEYYNMAHRTDFPYTNFFKQALWDIIDGGVFNRLTTVYNLKERPPCGADNQNMSFGFDQVVGVFSVWIFGLCLSLVSLLIEKQIYTPGRHKST